jgi:hypothetical protein
MRRDVGELASVEHGSWNGMVQAVQELACWRAGVGAGVQGERVRGRAERAQILATLEQVARGSNGTRASGAAAVAWQRANRRRAVQARRDADQGTRAAQACADETEVQQLRAEPHGGQ